MGERRRRGELRGAGSLICAMVYEKTGEVSGVLVKRMLYRIITIRQQEIYED